MRYYITEMTLDMYDELMALWQGTEGIWDSDDENYENLKKFLLRNPGLSLVVLYKDHIIGAIKCSHDGRRGYLHHLAVEKEFRKKGIGRELVEMCIQNLNKEGITKIRAFVLDTNSVALSFWKNLGFIEQVYDYRTMEFGD